jgi:amidase
MARTVADVAMLFSVVSGRDSLDPTSSPKALQSSSIENAKEITIGWLEDDGITPVTAETRQAVRATVAGLQKQGFRLRQIRPTSLESARRLWWIFFIQCGAMLYQPTIRGHEAKLSPIFKEFLDLAGQAPPLTADSLLHAWTQLDAVRAHLLREMEDTPILICPVCSVPAFRHGDREWDIEGYKVQYWDAMRYTQWFNFLGAPAAVVPVARSADGLPIGVQIAGVPHADEQVLSVAAAVERDFGYRPPPIS